MFTKEKLNKSQNSTMAYRIWLYNMELNIRLKHCLCVNVMFYIVND